MRLVKEQVGIGSQVYGVHIHERFVVTDCNFGRLIIQRASGGAKEPQDLGWYIAKPRDTLDALTSLILHEEF